MLGTVFFFISREECQKEEEKEETQPTVKTLTISISTAGQVVEEALEVEDGVCGRFA